jgi:hypothetical protein
LPAVSAWCFVHAGRAESEILRKLVAAWFSRIRRGRGALFMEELILFIVVIVWLVVQIYVLPKMGISS